MDLYMWAKQSLRTALFELDIIIGRTVANNTLTKMPISLYVHALPMPKRKASPLLTFI